MYKLKDYPNHLKAFIDARSAVNDLDYLSGDFLFFEYVIQLKRHDKTAVNVIEAWRDRPDVGDGLIYAALYPFDAADFEDSELPGDCQMEWFFLNVDTHIVHSKARAAKYCGTSIRTLERWMRDGLPYSKVGKERLFIEWDLWSYMTEKGVGQRVKNQAEYVEGQAF